MSTNSTISALFRDGQVRLVYCHWDGYPSHNGNILQENYQDQEKIENLILLGHISQLGIYIDCPPGHSYEKPHKGHTVFYNRDRGEDWEEVRWCLAGKGLKKDLKEEYNYFWNGTAWYVLKGNGNKWNELLEVLRQEKS